jgi:DNA primase
VMPDRYRSTDKRMTDPGAPNLAPPDLGRLRAALAEAARWYRERLLTDRPPLVVAVLRNRGLVDLAADTPAGQRWQLGHAPATRGSTALVGHLRGCGFTDRELLDAGVAVPGRHGGVIDALRHRLVIPLIDNPVDSKADGGIDGAGRGVVGFTARRLPDADTAVPKWVNTATTALYRKSEHLFGAAQQADLIAAGRGRPVLVEGAVDAIAVNLAGHVGLAAGGTRLTPDHAAQLHHAAAAAGGPLLVAYDPDPAGRQAVLRAADLLGSLDAHAVQLPAGRDPADVLVAAGSRGLRRALGGTVPLVDAAVTARLDRWAAHAGNPVALVDAVREVAPLVTGSPAGDRAKLISLIAGQLALPVEVVSGALLDAAAPA